MGESAQNFFGIGQSFDAVIMDASAPLIATASAKNRCNTFVYASDAAQILGTIASGNWIANNGKHKKADSIAADFIQTMNELGSRV